MASMCSVCQESLPPSEGPRARRYCSRACQAKAYRTRTRQREQSCAPAVDESAILAQYEAVCLAEVADRLAAVAHRLAEGRGAHASDLDLLAQLPVVLAARAPRGPEPAPAPMPEPVAPRRRLAVPKASRDASPRSVAEAPSSARSARKRKLSRKKADAVAGAAELHRHPEHRDNQRWVLRSGETALGYVEPSYGGISRSGRNGWNGRLAESGLHVVGGPWKTRQDAAVQLALTWVRVVTAEPRRDLTGD